MSWSEWWLRGCGICKSALSAALAVSLCPSLLLCYRSETFTHRAAATTGPCGLFGSPVFVHKGEIVVCTCALEMSHIFWHLREDRTPVGRLPATLPCTALHTKSVMLGSQTVSRCMAATLGVSHYPVAPGGTYGCVRTSILSEHTWECLLWGTGGLGAVMHSRRQNPGPHRDRPGAECRCCAEAARPGV